MKDWKTNSAAVGLTIAALYQVYLLFSGQADANAAWTAIVAAAGAWGLFAAKDAGKP